MGREKDDTRREKQDMGRGKEDKRKEEKEDMRREDKRRVKQAMRKRKEDVRKNYIIIPTVLHASYARNVPLSVHGEYTPTDTLTCMHITHQETCTN